MCGIEGHPITGVQGNGALVQLSTGTTTTNDFVKFDANGNTVDSGNAATDFQTALANYSTISGLTGYPSTFPPTTSGDWGGTWQTLSPSAFEVWQRSEG